MNIHFLYAMFILTGFLSGSIPFGYIAGKIKGIDIKKHGSGNIGATNAFRILGVWWGMLVFILDFLKGFVPVLISMKYLSYPELVAIAAVMGHIFTPFLKFKGGKGVATTIGVFSALTPVQLLISLGVWSITFIITRTSSISSMAFALSLPIVIALFKGFNSRFFLAIILFVLVIVSHRENIKRIIQGKEGKLR